MAEFYVLSQRKLRQDPAIGCLIEFEDVLLDACAATLLTPTWRRRPGPKWLHQRLNSLYQINLPAQQTREQQVLILTGMDWSICNVLRVIPHWRSRFDVVCAYILDAFLHQKPAHRSVSRFSRLVGSLDRVFIPMSGCIADYQQAFETPVTLLPYGCDVVQFGSDRCDRPIDLIGYGRQYSQHSQLFAQTYNAPTSQRMYYFTQHMAINKIHDFYAHRAWFWKILQRSQLALAYDPFLTDPDRFPFSFIAQRWFECLTAGCVVIGKRPDCPEADQLLDWEDATIELPDSLLDLIPFVEDLLADTDRLNAAHRRNYINALTYHDWRRRVAQMLDYLGLPHPPPLQRSLSDLQELARQN